MANPRNLIGWLLTALQLSKRATNVLPISLLNPRVVGIARCCLWPTASLVRANSTVEEEVGNWNTWTMKTLSGTNNICPSTSQHFNLPISGDRHCWLLQTAGYKASYFVSNPTTSNCNSNYWTWQSGYVPPTSLTHPAVVLNDFAKQVGADPGGRVDWWGMSAAARLLGLRVRFLPTACMFVFCDSCVLSRRGLCDGADPSSREILPSMCVSLSVVRYNINSRTRTRVGRRGQRKKMNSFNRFKEWKKCRFLQVLQMTAFQTYVHIHRIKFSFALVKKINTSTTKGTQERNLAPTDGFTFLTNTAVVKPKA